MVGGFFFWNFKNKKSESASIAMEKMIKLSKGQRLLIRDPMDAIPEKLQELMTIVESGDYIPLEQRVQAASQMAELMDREYSDVGVACLVNCLYHERDSRMLVHTIGILSHLLSESAVPAMIDILLGTHVDLYEHPPTPQYSQSDESLRLRCSAALALGKMKDGRAIIPLMSILNNRDENYRLRLAVAESLGKIGSDYAVPPLINILSDEREKSVYLKESAAKALGMLGDIRAVEPLIDMLEAQRGFLNKFNFLKEQIIEAIARIGRPSRKVTDSLVLALQDEAPSIRLAAVEALVTMGGEECVPSLQECVLDENDEVAKSAIYAIYRLGGEKAIRQLLTQENLPLFLRDELEGYIP